MDRPAAIRRLSSGEAFDLLVIGGGAVGLGIAVDAAARGLQVGLIERGDFGGGTSSRSTKLIHGGVRYLRQGNLKLVREGLRERARLLHNAPHLVSQLEFAVPCFGARDTLMYGAGLKFYDLLAAGHSLSPSRIISASKMRQVVPIKGDRLSAGVIYRDAQFDDARLAITLARTADQLGATLANYCTATELVMKGDRLYQVAVRDEETGNEFAIAAACFVNATGVFVDELCHQDDPAAQPLVTVSQGTHLVLPRRFLPGATALMIPKTSDGRVLFAIPWNGNVVLGTTDTPIPRAAREPRALAAEREFLLEHARRYLAEAPEPSDVLAVFAGHRPLVRKGGQVMTASLSREHSISISRSGLVTVTGGKWTTYRQMAEDVVDHARAVGKWPARPSPTANLLLHGAATSLAKAEEGGARGPHALEAPERGSSAEAHGDHALHLRSEIGHNLSPFGHNLSPFGYSLSPYSRYGSDAAEVARVGESAPGLAELIHPRLPYRKAEVVWQARHEMARTVEDVLARRTRALFLDARAAIEAAPATADLLAKALGRPTGWAAEQVSAFVALAEGYVFTHPASGG